MKTLEEKEADLRNLYPDLPYVKGVSLKQEICARGMRIDFLKSRQARVCAEIDKTVGTENADGESYTVETIKEGLRKKLELESLALYGPYRQIIETSDAGEIIDTIKCLRYF